MADNDVQVRVGAETGDFEDKFSRLASSIFSWKTIVIGAALAASAAFSAFAKSTIGEAEEARLSMARLGIALKNIGVDPGAKVQVQQTLGALSQMSNFSQTELTQAFTRLVFITRNYSESLKYMELATNLAAGTGGDLVSAAYNIGRALNGNILALRQYGISAKDVSSAQEGLNRLMHDYAGAAEATASPAKQLSNSMRELAQTIGGQWLPEWNSVLAALNQGTQNMTATMNANYTLNQMLKEGVITHQQYMSGTVAMSAAIEAYRQKTGEAIGVTQSLSAAVRGAMGDMQEFNGMMFKMTQTAGAVPGSISAGWQPQPFYRGAPSPGTIPGATTIINNNVEVNVAGSVQAERDLADTVRENLLSRKAGVSDLGF